MMTGFALLIALSIISAASALVPSFQHDRVQKQSFEHHGDHQRDHHERRAFIASSVTSTLALLTASANPPAAGGITPEQASRSYDTYAETYDNLDGGAIASSLGIDDARRSLLRMARGDVLEIGVGTGLNLASYRFDEIKSLTLVDISEGMLSQAKLRIDEMKAAGIVGDDVPVKLVRADATAELISLFGEKAFDTVVDTFSMCVMGNEGARSCLEQMTGVVKNSGDGGKYKYKATLDLIWQ